MALARSFIGLVLALGVAAAAACGDDGSADDAPPDDTTDPPAPTGPLFAIAVQVSGDVDTTAIALTDDVTANVEIDLSDAILANGRATAFPIPNSSSFIVTDGESPRFTRYDLGDDGEIRAGETLALPNVGAPLSAVIPTNFAFVSDTKAYLFDTFSREIVVWNPTEMTVVETLEAPAFDRDSSFGIIAFDQFQRDSELVVFTGYVNPVGVGVPRESRVFFIDTETDEVTRTLSTESCGYLRHGRQTASGDIYLGTDVFSTGHQVVSNGQSGGPSCVLRIAAGADDFDADFRYDPLAAPGATAAGSFVFVSDTLAFVRVLDESAPVDVTAPELNNGANWRWGTADPVAGTPVALVDDSPLGAAIVTPVTVDGDRFAVVLGADVMGSRLVRLNDDGTLTQGPTSEHFIRNAFRLR